MKEGLRFTETCFSDGRRLYYPPETTEKGAVMQRITGESCIFIGEAPAKLLFRPEGPVRLGNPVTGRVYRENIDFTVDRTAGTVARTRGSAIPFLRERDLYPAENVSYYPAADANAIPGGPGGRNLRFDAKLFFAEQQAEADYETPAPDWPEEFFRRSPYLAQTPEIRRMVALGDSITEGYNASGYIGGPPRRPPYAGLTAQALGAELFNLGRNGASVDLFESLIGRTVELRPDLVTVAYGMNDLTRYSAEQYLEKIASGVGKLRRELPRALIAVISPMSGNPEWSRTPVEKTLAFAEALSRWTAHERIVFADVSAVWEFVLERKGFFSLTGNGVNHPNDFGHFLYAKTVLAALGRQFPPAE